MSMKNMSWSAWGYGFVGAVKGAVITSILSYIGTNVAGLDLKWRQFGIVIGMAALVQGALYIQKSPMPFEVTEENNNTETK
jgi:hypothetical protein